MTVEISTLYGHLKTLNKQWFYEKSEIDAELSDVVRTSNTTGLLKNDGTVDTNTYLTEHQSLSNYIEKSSTTGLVKNDGTIDTNTYLTEHQSLTNYVEKSQTAGLIKNDGTIDTNTYLTEHQDISGKANSADLATVATTGSYTDLDNIPSTFAPTAHEHAAADVKDSNAHTNLGTSANATQAAINTAIDTKIGSLLAVELVEVTASLGTASSSTMNKLYLVAEATSETNDAYEIYVTVRTGSSGDYSYAWEKVDTARIDLSGYATSTHIHGNITNDGKIGSTSGKVVVTTTDGTLTTSDWVDEVDAVVQNLITYGTSLS